jgi:hypothetical protein
MMSEDGGAPFSGLVVRSFTVNRGRFREFFDWVRDGNTDDPNFRSTGDEVIDFSRFNDASKLGPEVIYQRRLNLPPEDLVAYFAGNAAAENLQPPVLNAERAPRMDDQDFYAVVDAFGAYPVGSESDPARDGLAAGGRDAILSFQLTLETKLFALDTSEALAVAGIDEATVWQGPVSQDAFDRYLGMRCRAILAHASTVTEEDLSSDSKGAAIQLAQAAALVDLAPRAFVELYGGARPSIHTAIDLYPAADRRPSNHGIPYSIPVGETDEEKLARIYGAFPGMAERMWGGRDARWDTESAMGRKWLTARAVVLVGDESTEVLCWISAMPDVPTSAIKSQVVTHLQSRHGAVVIPDLIELYDTEYLRPNSPMLLFTIDRKSRLSAEDYLSKYVRR